jgi:hypothetical protein
MKKIAVFLFALLVITGCNKKVDKPVAAAKPGAAFDTSDMKTKPIDNPNQGFLLRYNLAKDKKYSFRLTTISSDIQNIHADTSVNQQVKQQVVYLLDLTAKDIDKDGSTELSVNVSSIDMTAEANGKKVKYQSSNNKDAANKAQFAQFESLINNPFSVTITKTGEVSDVFRVDKIVNKILELAGNNAAQKISSEEKSMLKQKIIEGGLKPILVQLFRKLPDNNVAKDTTWQNKQPATRFLSYMVQTSNNFKVHSLELYNNDKIAVIDASLTAASQGKEKVSEKGVQYDIKKPITSGEGKIYFNVSKGVVQKSKTKSRVEFNMSMEAPSPKGGKQKIVKKEVMENTNVLELL